MQNIATIITPDTTISVAAIGGLIAPTNAIAATVAAHGGKTFQTNIVSVVNTAFDVAVTRLASVPGNRSAK
jgi:uncharacterized membrane protein